MSLQNALNKVFTVLGKVFNVPTNSAYCHARKKLKPEIFIRLNEIVCGNFYQTEPGEASNVKLWRGHRLVACDGTYLTLPDNDETRKEFTVQVNQYQQGDCVQALACVVYDLLNDIGLAAQLGKRQGEKKLLFSLWHATKPGDVIVLDRHYPDYTVFAYAKATQRDVIVRLTKSTFKAAQEFWHSEMPEEIITLKCPYKARAFVKEHNLPMELAVRLIRVELNNGTTEVLATTLLDPECYPATEFKQVYGWRWGQETYFGRVKNIFEVERFSGTTPLCIKQDFHAVLFLASLESVLSQPDEEALKEQARERKTRTLPQVNHAVSYLALVERVVQLLASNSPLDTVLDELHHLFRTNPTRARPDRQIERPKGLRYAFKLRFHKYFKRALA